jgi:hypothetical protein
MHIDALSKIKKNQAEVVHGTPIFNEFTKVFLFFSRVQGIVSLLEETMCCFSFN